MSELLESRQKSFAILLLRGLIMKVNFDVAIHISSITLSSVCRNYKTKILFLWIFFVLTHVTLNGAEAKATLFVVVKNAL